MPPSDLQPLLDQLRRDRRRHPHAGRREYSRAVRGLIAACQARVEGGDAATVVPVLRTAVNRVTKALMYMDDSSGIVGDDLRELMALYARACCAAPPPAASLAAWLVDLVFDGPGWPQVRLREFAPALGEGGLRRVAVLVEERAASADPEGSGAVFAVRHLREQLADCAGDVDRYVAVLAEDLGSPRQYRRIVAALREAGRPAEAIEWARRGLSRFDDGRYPDVTALRTLLDDLLFETGDADAAVAQRREAFERHPTAAGYRELARTVQRAGRSSGAAADWAVEVLTARVAAQELFVPELVEVLRAQDRDDDAWQVAARHRAVMHRSQWLEVLASRGKDHPQDVVAPYRELVDEKILDPRDAYRYKRAVSLLRELRQAYAALGDLDAFGAYLAELRQEHSQRPTFLRQLHDARLDP